MWGGGKTCKDWKCGANPAAEAEAETQVPGLVDLDVFQDCFELRPVRHKAASPERAADGQLSMLSRLPPHLIQHHISYTLDTKVGKRFGCHGRQYHILKLACHVHVTPSSCPQPVARHASTQRS